MSANNRHSWHPVLKKHPSQQTDSSRGNLGLWRSTETQPFDVNKARHGMMQKSHTYSPMTALAAMNTYLNENDKDCQDGGDLEDGGSVDDVKALQKLKEGLSRRFSTVYEAFTFLDMRGNWKISSIQLKLQLKRLGIVIPNILQAIRLLDKDSKDGMIDAKEFIHMVAWHPLHKDIVHPLHLAKLQVDEITARALALAAADLMFDPDSPDPPWHRYANAKVSRRDRRLGRISSAGSARSLTSTSDGEKGSFRFPLGVADGRTGSALLTRRTPSAGGISRTSSNASQTRQAKVISAASGADDHLLSLSSGTKATSPNLDNKNSQAEDEKPTHRRQRPQSAPIKVDMSWRRKLSVEAALQDAKKTSLVTASAADVLKSRSEIHNERNDRVSRRSKRNKLFVLFHKYDADDSGSLDAGEVTSLLSDMGFSYSQNEVESALKLVVPDQNDGGAIQFEDFCEWWECLDWFQEQGMTDCALSMASAKYKKREWLEEVETMKENLRDLMDEQSTSNVHDLRTDRLYEKYGSEDNSDNGTPQMLISTKHINMSTANHFFEFTQQISSRAKSQASMLMSKRRSSSAEIMKATIAQHKARRPPQQKYLQP